MSKDKQKIAIIIGAGPAGLTVALELLARTDIKPIVYEMSENVGGLAKTINHHGNKMDIGPHRFFSKSKRVNECWQSVLSLENAKSTQEKDNIFLSINRLTRIFYLRKLFNYPISLNWQTFFNLGLIRIIKIGFSYAKVIIFPIKNEKSLEDFFINRFGRELYLTFFKDYTEKLWGVPCTDIGADWGAQRVKGLSIGTAIIHAIKGILFKKNTETETSLVDKFFYPKYGSGQMWEAMAEKIKKAGGEIILNSRLVGLNNNNDSLEAVIKTKTESKTVKGDYVISSMPVVDLVKALGEKVPVNIKNIARGLVYRDIVVAGLLLDKFKIKNDTDRPTKNNIIPDNWLYIQERDFRGGRLSIFNNFSSKMVADENKIWLGLEYFCNQGDELWSQSDDEFKRFAESELIKIDMIDPGDVIDYKIIRVEKAYPAYFGTYNQFDEIRKYIDGIENLFLVGRNGMHRYNNMDHSMLSSMVVVDNIINQVKDKNNIWEVNTEKEYHEEK